MNTLASEIFLYSAGVRSYVLTVPPQNCVWACVETTPGRSKLRGKRGAQARSGFTGKISSG